MHLPALANLASLATIIAGYNTNLSKIYSILSLLWQENKWGIEVKVGINAVDYTEICTLPSYDSS